MNATFAPLVGFSVPPAPKSKSWLVPAVAIAMGLAACATSPKALVPDQPPPAVQVLVPMQTPCKVEKVEPSPLVTERLGGAGGDLYEAVKRILADRTLLISDRTKLVAANSDPCPVASKDTKPNG